MGLDVYLTTYNKAEYKRAQSHNNVGDQISCPARKIHSFHKFNALANWIDEHVDDVQPLKPVLRMWIKKAPTSLVLGMN